MKAALKSIYIIWWRDIKRYFEDKYRLVSSAALPIMYLFILGGGMAPAFRAGETGYQSFLFPGIIGMTILFTGVFFAFSIIWDREFGFLKGVLVAPIPRWAIAVGKSLSGTTIASIQGLIILLLAPLVGVNLNFTQILEITLIMIVTAFAMASIGIMIAARMKSHEGFQAIMSFLLMPLFFLSGAMFPLNGVPAWLLALSHLDPLTYGVDALRGVAINLHYFTLGFDLLAILAFSAVMVAASVYAFSQQE